ncbi:DNA repair protein RecN [Myxococcota bacterium]|nr:DNA repair protein RecN [Myxococcota bacterium]
MIRSLHIEGIAVVESAEVDFGPGLNVLTGETGTGKSLILSALNLLSGARAPKDVVRQGYDKAIIEAIFDTRSVQDLELELQERGLETDDHELIVRREIAREGKSKARISGNLVPISRLSDLLGGRLEISSQHDSQALLKPEFHGRLLDSYAGLMEDRNLVREEFGKMRDLLSEYDRLSSESAERAKRQDYLRFQIEEIDSAEIKEGEFQKLASSRSRLAHIEQVLSDLGAAVALLDGDPADMTTVGAIDLITQVETRVSAASKWDESLEVLVSRLQEVQAEVSDLVGLLREQRDATEVDPAELLRIEDRWRALDDLRRKYGEDEKTILQQRDTIATELSRLSGSDSRIQEVERELEEIKESLRLRSIGLSKARNVAADDLSEKVTTALESLALPGASFQISLDSIESADGLPYGPNGNENISFLFSANRGSEPRPLQNVASGGELSRLLLALKGAARSVGQSLLIVFDEVDAGIGGRAADRVGDLLADLSRDNQVLCITHLPQIAARGSRHFRVEKESAEGNARTKIVSLSKSARVEEIARMAGGEVVTSTTRKHARELLARSVAS